MKNHFLFVIGEPGFTFENFVVLIRLLTYSRSAVRDEIDRLKEKVHQLGEGLFLLFRLAVR